VCLSLLRTWMSGAKGEEWQSGVSTILQVLISIQATILCEYPEGNGVQFSSHYRQNYIGGRSILAKSINSLTIQYGIMSWAQNAPPLWQDIVETHLRKQGDKILQTAERWAGESRQESHDSSYMRMGGVVTDISTLMSGLQKSLKKYWTTHVIQAVEQQPRGGGTGHGSQMSPYGGGNRFDGSGRKSGYGGFGSQIGRGY
jgi:hypothetical protein